MLLYLLVIATAASADECKKPVLASAKNIAIEAEVTRTRLSVGTLPAKTELVLRNIHFDVHPGTQFHVLLQRADDPAKRVRVGTLSFYASTKAPVTTTRTFDVTDELRQLGASGTVDVVLEATTGRGGATESTFNAQSKFTVGAIELRAKGK